jgi:hypothetical protein
MVRGSRRLLGLSSCRRARIAEIIGVRRPEHSPALRAAHGRFRRAPMDTTLAAVSVSPSRNAAHSAITGRRLSSMSLRL